MAVWSAAIAGASAVDMMDNASALPMPTVATAYAAFGGMIKEARRAGVSGSTSPHQPAHRSHETDSPPRTTDKTNQESTFVRPQHSPLIAKSLLIKISRWGVIRGTFSGPASVSN
jgi:hypothetical protein